MYSSTLSLTMALHGVCCQRHAPATVPPGYDPVPVVQEAGWALGPIWTGTKISPPPGFDSRRDSLCQLRYSGPRTQENINYLTPNGHYMCRTAQLTSRCRILYIYSTNIRTEYFKRAA